ncbi:MAG: tryptophan 7-halogenase [Nannocystaceae bacterium]
MSDSYDLIVVGGGPAGATVGTLVAKKGGRVLLLEKEKFPRYQIGESLLPSTTQVICALLGVHKEVHDAGFVTKRGGTFKWGHQEEPWTFHFADSSVTETLGFVEALQVERSRFDEILLRNAERKGVEVRERCAVKEVTKEEDRVCGLAWRDAEGEEHRAQSRFVVDASGNLSSIHTAVGKREYSEFFKNAALFCYYENGRRLPEPNSGNVFTVAFEDGWFWYIPLSDTLTSVGAVVHKDVAKGFLNQEGAMDQLLDKCPRVKALLEGATRVTSGPYGKFRIRKDYAYCNERLWVPGMMLVGDAACFIDPVFSTGVHSATYAGLLAARSINTLLAGELDEKTCYDAFQRRYLAEYRAQYKFLLGFYDMNASLDDYFWKARSVLGTQERTNDAFVRIVAGAATAADDFFQTLIGAGEALTARVDRSMGVQRELERTPAAFEIERTEGAAVDLVPPRLLSNPSQMRGTAIPGAIVPTDDGLKWRRVEEKVALRPEEMLRVTVKPTWDMRDGAEGPELYILFGTVELCFEDRNLVAFGKTLVRRETFRAGDTRRWAAYGEFRWEDIREILDQLLAEGVLRRISPQSA